MTQIEKAQADYIEVLEADLCKFRELVTNLMLTLEIAQVALQTKMLINVDEKRVH